MIIRLLSVFVSLIVFGATSVVYAADEPQGRPGLALKFDTDGKEAKLIVAFDYLQGAEDRPRLEGVRRYTYTIPLGNTPVRVGWEGDKPISVLLDEVKYVYTPGFVDRQENGSIRIARVDNREGAYRIRGVYHYFDQLFVIDAVVKPGHPIFLYEKKVAQ
jgi:hypothetical protein